MLGIMNYMYNNIELLNKYNLSTNEYSGNKSDDNKKVLPSWFLCANKNGSIKTTE